MNDFLYIPEIVYKIAYFISHKDSLHFRLVSSTFYAACLYTLKRRKKIFFNKIDQTTWKKMDYIDVKILCPSSTNHIPNPLDPSSFFVFGEINDVNTQKGVGDLLKVSFDLENMSVRTERLVIMNIAGEGTAPNPRGFPSLHSFLIHGRWNILVFGGQERLRIGWNFFNDVFTLDIQDGPPYLWKPVKINGIKPQPRVGHRTAIIQNKMYVFAGCSVNFVGDYTHYNDVWCLNLIEWKWEKINCNGSYSERHSPTINVLNQNEILVSGGNVVSLNNVNDAFMFNISNNSITVLEPLKILQGEYYWFSNTFYMFENKEKDKIFLHLKRNVEGCAELLDSSLKEIKILNTNTTMGERLSAFGSHYLKGFNFILHWIGKQFYYFGT